MRGFKAFAFAATASVLLAGSLQAQQWGQVEWNGVNVTRVHSGYRSAAYGEQDIYRSPYRARLDMGFGFGSVVDIFCVDFAHHSNQGTYDAVFTNLGGKTDEQFADLGTTRGTLTQYLQAAFLANEMVNTTTYTKTDPYQREDQLRVLQGAMWEILYGYPIDYRAQSSSTWLHGAIDTWKGRAVTGAAGMNAYEWTVVTDANLADGPDPRYPTVGGDHQEYLTRVQVTPEPATMLLLGTGLVVMLMAAGALRRPVA